MFSSLRSSAVAAGRTTLCPAGARSGVGRVGPQRDREAITLLDAWPHSRLKSRHRALRFREPLSKLDFELCDLMRHRCNPVRRLHFTDDRTSGVRPHLRLPASAGLTCP